jgi:DNA helicase-2/ATP-dependent DNA helicase PcrA
MNTEQLNAVISPAPWNMVIAGPGSGKSKVVVERARHLGTIGFKPEQQCFVTFTNVAARVLKQRLLATIGKPGFVGTLHAMMLMLLRRDDPRWVMVGEQDAGEFLARHATLMDYKGTATALEAARGLAMDDRSVTQAARVVRSYRQWMRGEHLLDFDMVLTEGLKLMKVRGSNPWPCWSVDEYQDSSPVDAAIYLAAKPEQLLIVADSDQSVYKFRGARPENVTEFWNMPDLFAHHVLNLNYRCGREICDVANAVISLNPDRIDKKTESALGDGATVKTFATSSDDAERATVRLEIEMEIAAGVGPAEIAVLCRTNRLADEIREDLHAAGIPVAERESEKKPRDWRLLLLILQQIASPGSWANARLLAREQARIQRTSPDDAERNLEEYRKRCPNAAIWALPSLQVILSLNADLHRYGVSSASHALMAERIRIFRPDTVEALLECLRASPEAKSIRGVNILTCHAAKGEEFDSVIVPGAELFTADTPEEMAEERRLFFVAVTRAKKSLVVTSARQRRMTLPNNKTVLTNRQPGELFETVAALTPATV